MDTAEELRPHTASATTLAQVARLVTASAPAPLCCACIATTLGRRLSSVRQAAARLEGSQAFTRRHDRCAACRQSRLVIGLAEAPADTDGRPISS